MKFIKQRQIGIIGCIMSILLFVLWNTAQCQTQYSTQQDNKIYHIDSVDTAPTYPGGIIKLYNFLIQNINYPTAAYKIKKEGIAYISFVVEKDGSLHHFEIKKSLGYGTDKEAIRTLSRSKRWNPAMHKGNLVRVKHTLPIKFSLAKKKPATAIAILSATALKKHINPKKLPLFKVDGDYITAEKFYAIDFNEFLKIDIVKDPDITALHEKKAAKNGIITARTKTREKKFLESIKGH